MHSACICPQMPLYATFNPRIFKILYIMLIENGLACIVHEQSIKKMIWLKFNFFANSVISIIKETVPENLNCMLSCRCKPSCKTFDIIVQINKLGYYFKSNHLKLHVHAPFKPAVSSSRYPPVIWSTTVDHPGLPISNVLKVFHVMTFLRRPYY